MGRVFSYDQLVADQLPRPADFKNARTIFGELCQDGIAQGLIDGAYIYGSVAINQQGPRSDFDAVIATTESTLPAYEAARDISVTIFNETRGVIPADILTRPKQWLVEGRHDFDRFFGQHLSCNERLIWGNDPSEYTTYWKDSWSAKNILADYLFHKKRRLLDAHRNINPLDIRDGGIQRMLELPCAVGRKALQAISEAKGLAQQPVQSADKQEVTRKTRDFFAHYGLDGQFDSLVEANDQYTYLAVEAEAGNVTRREYEQYLEWLHSRLPQSVMWIDDIEQRVLPLFDEA